MKPGLLTTEFWGTAAIIIGVLAGAIQGAIPPEIAGAIAGGLGIGYQHQRTRLKRGPDGPDGA